VNPTNKKVAGLILAAGASSRMGQPKALLSYQGESFLDRLVRLFSAPCEPVIVVLGHDAELIRAKSERLSSAWVVVNPTPEDGQLSSLQRGLMALHPECDGVVFCPVDLPAVAPETVCRVAETLAGIEVGEQAPLLVIPRFAGRRGHPVGIRRELFAEILSLPPGARASDVIHNRLDAAIYVDGEDPGIHRDIDTPADYHSLLGMGHSK
jgi:molybdenum cofactor cytidylyltransferase